MHLIDEFVRLTEGTLPACSLFRKWAAIFGVAAVTRRRVWMVVPGYEDDTPLFPNLYILLVAEPGVGKTVTANRIQKLLKNRPEIRFTPHDITGPALLKNMADPERRDPMEEIGGRSLQVTHRAAIISEWANFLPHDDFEFMSTLSALWDSEDSHEKETIMRGTEEVTSIYLNIIAGVQPAWFAEEMPRGAFRQGLFARIILVFSDEKVSVDEEAPRPARNRWNGWLAEIDKIMMLKGEVRVLPEAAHAMKAWRLADYAPKPEHALLQAYAARRHMQAWKLAMISALAERRDLTIRASDIEWAKATLIEAEASAPNALAFAGNNASRLYEEMAVQYVLDRWFGSPSKDTSEGDLRLTLSRNIATQYMDATVEGLVAAQRLSVVMGEKPNRKFKPGINARKR